MNILSISSDNKFLTLPLCFVGGCALNRASIAANRLAAKYLGLPIDPYEGQEYDTYTKTLIEKNEAYCRQHEIEPNRKLGALLGNVTIAAIRSEFSYRFLLETIVLPRISSSLAPFSIARTCVSNLLFASRCLDRNFPQKALAAHFLHIFLLGIICSLAQEKIGLIGSMFIHVGYNFSSWQLMFNQKPREVVEKIRAIHLTDIVSSGRGIWHFRQFIRDTTFPLVLGGRAMIKAVNYVHQKAQERQGLASLPAKT